MDLGREVSRHAFEMQIHFERGHGMDAPAFQFMVIEGLLHVEQ
jgi:hypothetical protein